MVERVPPTSEIAVRAAMNDNLLMHQPLKPVERLFPFAVRSGIIVPGRDGMARKRRKLLFVLITTDLSPKSRVHILRTFAPLPIIERYTSTDVQAMFTFYGAKVLGFVHCPLSKTILREMKEFIVAAAPVTPAAAPELSPPATAAESVATASTSGQDIPQPTPPPSAEPAPSVTPPREARLGWRARRKQQKDERLTAKLRKKTP